MPLKRIMGCSYTKTDDQGKKLKKNSKSNEVMELTSEEEALFVAISFGKVHRIVSLLQQVENVDVRNMEMKTPLICACESMPPEAATHIARQILKQKCNINAQDNLGHSALMHACMDKSKIDTVRVLVREKQCDTNLMDQNGYTALMHAVTYDNMQAVDLLVFGSKVKCKVDLDVHSLSGCTATDIAVNNKNAICCYKLVRLAGADTTHVQDVARLSQLLDSVNIDKTMKIAIC